MAPAQDQEFNKTLDITATHNKLTTPRVQEFSVASTHHSSESQGELSESKECICIWQYEFGVKSEKQ